MSEPLLTCLQRHIKDPKAFEARLAGRAVLMYEPPPEKEIGEAWDSIDDSGRKLLMDGGMQPIRLAPDDNARFRKIGAEVTDAKIKELEGKGLPARAAYDMMKALADKHAKTSRNFWTQ